MIVVVVLVAALLAVVAAAGILAPFRAGRADPPEAPDDPLAEERDRLLRTIRDLEEDRATGRTDAESYRRQRVATERRAVRVLDALESGNGQRQPPAGGPRGMRLATALVATAVVAAAVLPAVLGAAGRPAPQPAPAPPSLTDLEERVARFPQDPAARLDLADAYLARGDVEGAIDQYVVVLEIDPRNAEAHVRLGALLFRAGRPRAALDEVDRALEIAPSYPEALYQRGRILALGLDRPEAARAALRAYLEEAPFGAHRDEARALLGDLRGRLPSVPLG